MISPSPLFKVSGRRWRWVGAWARDRVALEERFYWRTRQPDPCFRRSRNRDTCFCQRGHDAPACWPGPCEFALSSVFATPVRSTHVRRKSLPWPYRCARRYWDRGKRYFPRREWAFWGLHLLSRLGLEEEGPGFWPNFRLQIGYFERGSPQARRPRRMRLKHARSSLVLTLGCSGRFLCVLYSPAH